MYPVRAARQQHHQDVSRFLPRILIYTGLLTITRVQSNARGSSLHVLRSGCNVSGRIGEGSLLTWIFSCGGVTGMEL